MEVFAVMDDGELWNRYWDRTTGTSGSRSAASSIPTRTPAASSWGADRLDVYARGVDGRTWHRWWDGIAVGPLGAARISRR